MHTLWLTPFAALLSLATTFVEQPFPDVVQKAPVIVRGKVGMRYSDWGVGTDGNKRIYTYTELRVDEAVKGQVSGQNIVMRELGGEKDGIGMQIAGSAEFQKGEDVVVFLMEANPDGTHTVQGMMMGKYNVRQDASGQDYIEGAGLSGQTHPALRGKERLLHPDGGHGDTKAGAAYTLQALRDLVREQGQNADAQAAAPKPSIKVEPSPSAAPEAPRQGAQAGDPALQLQSQHSETPLSPWAMVVGAGVALVGIALLIRLRRKR